MNIRTSSWLVSREVARQQDTLEKHIANSNERVSDLSGELTAQQSLIQQNTSWAQRLVDLLSGYVSDIANRPGTCILSYSSCLLPQVTVLVDLVGKIWAMDQQIFDMLRRQQNTTTAPDLQHTWFQRPVKFEDALGRILPVPSEYNLGVHRLCMLESMKR